MSVSKQLEECLKEYVAHLQADYDKHYNRREFYYEFHRKYVHIISKDDNQRSSHSWVMINDDKQFKQGDILKSASWKAPARNFARGNVLCGGFQHIKWAGA
jgi:hypothetical protein